MFCEFVGKFRRLVLIALGWFCEEKEENRIFLSNCVGVKDSQNIHTTLESNDFCLLSQTERKTGGKTLRYSISQTTLKK